EEAEGWRTNHFHLPIVGASDGGAFTTVQDIATLWKAFWGYEILSKELVEIYAQPYVKAETKSEPSYYGHGLWIGEDACQNREEYITGCDAGVSFKSKVNRSKELQVTVLSNTAEGAWPVWRDIETALKGESGRG